MVRLSIFSGLRLLALHYANYKKSGHAYGNENSGEYIIKSVTDSRHNGGSKTDDGDYDAKYYSNYLCLTHGKQSISPLDDCVKLMT